MKKGNSGFTLIEILVVVAVIGILSAIAAPSIITWREKARFTGSIQALTADLKRGKMSAVQDNGTCRVNLTATDYTIFLDRNNDDNFVAPVATPPGAGEDILISTKVWEPGFIVRFGDFSSGSPVIVTLPEGFEFNSRGQVDFGGVLAGKSRIAVEINGNDNHQGFVYINSLGRIGQSYQ